MEKGEAGPDAAAMEGSHHQRRRPSGLHRLLLRVHCVELAGSASPAGGQPPNGRDDAGAGDDMVSPRPSRRRALLGEGVCEVVALADTMARTICRSLVEAAMPVASAEEVERFALVMVHPTREEDGSLTHILHTLLPEERPIELVEAVLARCRSPQSPLGFTAEQLLDEHLISWFLKDLGAAPLDFRGYVTGAEASEDEEAGSADVAAEMGQGYHSGFLLKKSSQDPCLWRRRWCVLGEDRLWYMKLKRRRTPGRAAAISLVANHIVEHPHNSRVQYGIEVHTPHRVFLFRAADRAQQLGWVRALQTRVRLASENDLIGVAELMICDEEQARARRMQQALEVVWAAAGAQGTGEGSTPLSSTDTARCERRLQEAMALAMAVQEFRERCRLDLVSSEQKWEAAQRIFDDFVLQQEQEQEEGGEGDDQGVSSSRSQREAVREVERQLFEHAEQLRAEADRRSAGAAVGTGGMARKMLAEAVPRFFGGASGALPSGVENGTAAADANGQGDDGGVIPPPPRSLFDALLDVHYTSMRERSLTPPPPPPP